MKKRHLFAELTQGLEALADERQRKRTLRATHAEPPLTPSVAGDEAKRLQCVCAIFDAQLHQF